MSSQMIVIPARYGSTRFPGKPLYSVAGVSLLERVWRIGCAAIGNKQDVVIATDDERIVKAVREFGGKSVMTSSELQSGTDRVYAVLEQLQTQPEYILNFQGDAVLTPPEVLQQLLARLPQTDAEIVTPAVRMSWDELIQFHDAKVRGEVGGTTVVFNRSYKALYFSKQVLPFIRSGINQLRSKSSDQEFSPVYRHIGLYGFSLSGLKRFVNLDKSPLEELEGLEQLRALENGINVQVCIVDYKGRTHLSIDSPEDVKRVEECISKEGEIC